MGVGRKLQNGPGWCEQRGGIDVDLFKAGTVNRRDSISDGVLFDSFGQRLTRLLVNQLGVAQTADAVAGFKDHCTGDDGAKEAASADFVYAGDQGCARSPRQFFKACSALQPLEEPHLVRAL